MIPNATIDTKSLAPIKERIRLAISRIAENDCPVLILGEHGVGKRSTAQQLHLLLPRRRGTYSEIRSGDLDLETLLAVLSTNCTVYLSEISSLSLPMQDALINLYFRSNSLSCRLLFGSCREPVDDLRSSA